MSESQVASAGNAAAMREALTKVKEWMEHRIATCGFEFSATFPTMLEDVVLPALAKPPRNCDVGTAEEQDARYNKLCEPLRSCGQCPVYVKSQGVDHCEFVWAQMPYRKGDAK